MRTKEFALHLPQLPRRLKADKGEDRSEALLRTLREIALEKRTTQAQRFYSLRQVAKRFQLPLSLVSRVFIQLEAEGLLSRIRGSRTVLHSTSYDRALHILGVAGLPVSSFRFAFFADYRELILQLRRRLRRRGIMPAEVFYAPEQARGRFITERLRDAATDTVIWLWPDSECKETMERLRDAGIRVLGGGDFLPNWIPCRYRIERGKALRELLRKWRQSGLTRAVLVMAPRGHSVGSEQSYFEVAGSESFPCRGLMLDEVSPKVQLKALMRHEQTGILFTAPGAVVSAVRGRSC